MKALLKGGLCLALGWAAARADAQEETRWRPASAPLAATAPSGAVPAYGVPQPDQVRRVSLQGVAPFGEAATSSDAGSGVRPPLVRGQIPDERPLPLGPAYPSDVSLPPPRPIAPGVGNPPAPSSPGPLVAPPISPGTSTMTPPAGPGTFTGPPPQMIGPGPVTTAPPLTSRGIWGTTLPPGACDCCTDCSPPSCGPCGPCGPSCGVRCGPFCGFRCGDCCTGSCFGPCDDPCCNPRCSGGLFWVSADYLLWFTRSQMTPPLVTTSPLGTPQGIGGIPGLPTTTTVFDHINNNPYSGARFQAGFWFPRCNDWGVDASYFFLSPRSETRTFGTANGVEVFRPVTDVSVNPPVPAPEVVSFGLVNGAVAVHDYSQLWSFDVNLRKRLFCGCNYWLDVFGGYRHFNLTEGIDITENLMLPADIDPVTKRFVNNGLFQNIVVFDSFRTVNNFDGGQLGVQGQWNFLGRFFVNGTFKMAMGNVHQTLDISGATTVNSQDPRAMNGTAPGGVLALPGANIGHYSANHFAVLPEVGVKLGVDLTQHLRAYVGYDFVYLSSVIRPGDLINTNVNTTRVPFANVLGVTPTGPFQPSVLFRTTDYWAQGVNFGLQYHW
jgi:hypothetical protein